MKREIGGILGGMLDWIAILVFVISLVVLGLACLPVALFRWADRRVTNF